MLRREEELAVGLAAAREAHPYSVGQHGELLGVGRRRGRVGGRERGVVDGRERGVVDERERGRVDERVLAPHALQHRHASRGEHEKGEGGEDGDSSQ